MLGENVDGLCDEVVGVGRKVCGCWVWLNDEGRGLLGEDRQLNCWSTSQLTR